MNLAVLVEKERKEDILVLNCESVCTLCVHRTAHSCCRVHQSAAVFIGWWPRNANSCIIQGQRHKVRRRGHRTPDVFTALLFTSTSALNASGTHLMQIVCLHRICCSILLAHQRLWKQGRHVGHVHSSTEGIKCVSQIKQILKCHFLKSHRLEAAGIEQGFYCEIDFPMLHASFHVGLVMLSDKWTACVHCAFLV